MRRLLFPLLAAALASACAGTGPRGDTDWSSFRTAALRVDSRVDDTEIEVNWLKKLVKIELERGKFFEDVRELKEDTPGSDLHIFLTIVRKKGWLWNKLFVDIEFIDARTNNHLGRERMIVKASTRAKDARSRHKAAGQIAYKVARRVAGRLAEHRGPAPLPERPPEGWGE